MGFPGVHARAPPNMSGSRHCNTAHYVGFEQAGIEGRPARKDPCRDGAKGPSPSERGFRDEVRGPVAGALLDALAAAQEAPDAPRERAALARLEGRQCLILRLLCGGRSLLLRRPQSCGGRALRCFSIWRSRCCLRTSLHMPQ